MIREQLRRALSSPLPGAAAQYTMAPDHRPGPEIGLSSPEDAKLAAVLILFYPHPDDETVHIPMMRRPDNTGPHSRQISFPGGAYEEHDSDLRETALRESEEELGIRPADVEVLGELTQLYVPPSGYLVSSYVGWSDRRPDFVPDPREVDEILEIPVDIFLDATNRAYEHREMPRGRTKVPFFKFQQDKIWGASAMMLGELTALLKLNQQGG